MPIITFSIFMHLPLSKIVPEIKYSKNFLNTSHKFCSNLCDFLGRQRFENDDELKKRDLRKEETAFFGELKTADVQKLLLRNTDIISMVEK